MIDDPDRFIIPLVNCDPTYGLFYLSRLLDEDACTSHRELGAASVTLRGPAVTHRSPP